VPGFDSEVSVLAIGDGLPTGLEDGRERLFRQIVIDGVDGDAVDSGTDGIAGVDGVNGTGYVDAYSLCDQRRGENQETNYACRFKKAPVTLHSDLVRKSWLLSRKSRHFEQTADPSHFVSAWMTTAFQEITFSRLWSLKLRRPLS
jgi:hypothetical protein